MSAAFSAFRVELLAALDYVESDPKAAVAKSRTVLEAIVAGAYVSSMGKPPKKCQIGDMLSENQFSNKIDGRVLNKMHNIKSYGNTAIHVRVNGVVVPPPDLPSKDAVKILDDLCDVIDWYLFSFPTGATAEEIHQGGPLRDAKHTRAVKATPWRSESEPPTIAAADQGNASRRTHAGQATRQTAARTFPEPDTLEFIDTPEKAAANQRLWAERLGLETVWVNDLGQRFRLIPPGRFALGAPAGDSDASPNERPQVIVALSRPFFAAETPLSNALIQLFLATSGWEQPADVQRLLRDRAFAPRCRRGENLDGPAVELSAFDATVICGWLGRRDGRTYRLPTEAEWESIARGGDSGPAPQDIDMPNAWGIRNFIGSIAEWTDSLYGRLDCGMATRSAAGRGDKGRVVRGASWRDAESGPPRYTRRQPMAGDARRDFIGTRILCEVQ